MWDLISNTKHTVKLFRVNCFQFFPPNFFFRWELPMLAQHQKNPLWKLNWPKVLEHKTIAQLSRILYLSAKMQARMRQTTSFHFNRKAIGTAIIQTPRVESKIFFHFVHSESEALCEISKFLLAGSFETCTRNQKFSAHTNAPQDGVSKNIMTHVSAQKLCLQCDLVLHATMILDEIHFNSPLPEVCLQHKGPPVFWVKSQWKKSKVVRREWLKILGKNTCSGVCGLI